MSINTQNNINNCPDLPTKPNFLININDSTNKFIFNQTKTLERENHAMKTQNNFFNRKNLIIRTNSRNTHRQYYLDRNYTERNTKNNNLFSRIKKLLSDFQKEKDAKNRLYKTNKKSKKKSKGKDKKTNTLLVPQKKVYYITPKVKNQMQLNHYLINDFKEIDSEQDYIKRSLKYQKMNEELDELVLMNQIKEAEKIGVSENIMNEYEKKNNNYEENWQNSDRPDDKVNENNQNSIKSDKKVLTPPKKSTSLFNGNNYELRMRRLYTNKIVQLPKNNFLNKEKENNEKIKDNNSRNEALNYPCISSKTVSIDKYSLFDLNIIDNIKHHSGNKYIIDKNNQYNFNSINTTNFNDNNTVSQNTHNFGQKRNKKKKTKRENLTIDKYAFSNRLYKSHQKEYNKYLRNKYIMRGKNFSNQMSLLHKEKEKFGLEENDTPFSPSRRFPILDQTKLLYQIKLKDAFTNSFKAMRIFNEGDQDLDLDNLNKIKQYIKDYEIEMTRVMKNAENLNVIKKRFNKSTVGKFHSTRGIYM